MPVYEFNIFFMEVNPGSYIPVVVKIFSIGFFLRDKLRTQQIYGHFEIFPEN